MQILCAENSHVTFTGISILLEVEGFKHVLFADNFTQIKERFGLLRVYFRPWDDAIRQILDAAEQKSATCCEKCGRSGKIICRPSLRVTCGSDHDDGREWRT